MSIYKICIKRAWALIRQEHFFSSVYIVGAESVISMVVVLTATYHIRTANIAPEVHRGRICYLSNMTYKLNDTKGNYETACGLRPVKEVIGNLHVPEDVAVTTSSLMMPFPYSDAFIRLPGGDEFPKARSKGCGDGFWHIYHLDLVEGRPFTEAEFLSGMPRAVLCHSLAGRLFGHETATGQAVLLNGLEYTVSGIVGDVSGITADVYAEAWVAYSLFSVVIDHALGKRDGTVGLLEANILLVGASDLSALSEELRREVGRYNSGLSGRQMVCEKPLSYADDLLSELFGLETYIVLGMALLLFLLVLALNLPGANTSRTQECVGEPGIHRAFGATKTTLVGQVSVEGIVLVLPGDVAGLLFPYVLMFIFRNAPLAPGFNLLGTNGNVLLSLGMLLNMSVFTYAFGVRVTLNLFPSMLPA